MAAMSDDPGEVAYQAFVQLAALLGPVDERIRCLEASMRLVAGGNLLPEREKRPLVAQFMADTAEVFVAWVAVREAIGKAQTGDETA